MNKAVLISIQPFWCAKIANGVKTIEVRKTRPKKKAPFRCFIYCTNAGRPLVYGDIPTLGGWREEYTQTYGYSREAAERIWEVMNGKIIGEFVCAEIARYAKYGKAGSPARYMKTSPGGYPPTEIHHYALQLDPEELEQYGKGAPLYGWQICDLQIYGEGELRALSDFGIKRPPQSWCYVEEVSEKEDRT